MSALPFAVDRGIFARIPPDLLHDPTVSGAMTKLYGIVADLAHGEQVVAWPSNRCFQEAMKITDRHARRLIKAWEQRGELRRVKVRLDDGRLVRGLLIVRRVSALFRGLKHFVSERLSGGHAGPEKRTRKSGKKQKEEGSLCRLPSSQTTAGNAGSGEPAPAAPRPQTLSGGINGAGRVHTTDAARREEMLAIAAAQQTANEAAYVSTPHARFSRPSDRGARAAVPDSSAATVDHAAAIGQPAYQPRRDIKEPVDHEAERQRQLAQLAALAKRQTPSQAPASAPTPEPGPGPEPAREERTPLASKVRGWVAGLLGRRP